MSEPELNTAQTEKMIKLYKTGLTAFQVGKILNVRYGIVWERLWKLKLPQQRIEGDAV